MLIDTSALIAYFNKEDLYHQASQRIISKLKGQSETIDILDTVFEESLAVLRKRHSRASAIHAAEMMTASSAINLVCIGKNTLLESSSAFVQHEGKYSYVDCSLVVWAKMHNIKTIIAIDRHFSELGLIVIP